MKGYASRTGTLRNVAALQAAGWGFLVTPQHDLSPMRLAHVYDCGTWHAFTQEKPWDSEAFMRGFERVGPSAEWVVLPDVVADREASLKRSAEWLPRLQGKARLMFAVQDGMTARDIEPFRPHIVGLFLGGSTAWKEAKMAYFGRYAARRQLLYHVARVNTARRMALANAAHATSFDGSSVTMFAKTLPLLDGARRQPDLFAPTRRLALLT